MSIGRQFGHALAALAVSIVVGCGGGGGGEPTAGIDRGGITIAQGPISGFGSVIVNGVRYSTTGATITVDDRPGTESELRVGQVVRVTGTVDSNGTTGTARSVSFDYDVEGPVQSIDLVASRLVVAGQTVQVGAGTSFDDSIGVGGLDNLQVGDLVEVSGLTGSSGVIDATRIERGSSAGSTEVEGYASSVNTTARTLRINGLSVDYSAAQLDGFASGQPANGDLIEAVGTLSGAGTLVATRLEKRSAALSGTTNDEADLEGLITRYASATDFDVAGQRVTTTAATRYEGGTSANLSLDVNVEVEGGFDASGRVVAEKVEFGRDGDTEIAGSVESVDAAAGSLRVLGQTILTTAQTRFEDNSAAGLQRFGLADLRTGDLVEVHVYNDGANLVATVLEREDANSEVEIKGIASDVAPPNMTVAGVPVTTDAQTEFRDNNGASISAAAFFAAAPGREVKVRGSLVGDTVLADRAELED
jgi:hypothetical protein